MEEAPINTEHATYQPTGAEWDVTPEGIIAVVLGMRGGAADSDGVNEAEWLQEQFENLKQRHPSQHWKVLIDLHMVPADHRPLMKASSTYTHILSDDMIAKVALVSATMVQKAIVAILLPPAILSDRVHYFTTQDSAREWLLADHHESANVRW